jgi:hypothetical protein
MTATKEKRLNLCRQVTTKHVNIDSLFRDILKNYDISELEENLERVSYKQAVVSKNRNVQAETMVIN